ncbi:unnamed protein product [Adineta steineri]|uniref:Uncharacterized protein n=1 Tax=Adineta steineri TaxID=433720 RepID=A0A814SQ57_9BILA|nr:unnamed protein product [Adineta steineri]CAF1482831.1 unnamed protein product [Adineta steineri]
MSIPQPPDDPETRNIIEKLASFVARNGPEFEAAARQKHENNPKFSFLHGGDYQHYYAFCVQAEKALHQQPPNPFHLPPPNILAPPPMSHHSSRPTLPPFTGPPPPPGTNGPPPPPWTQPPPSHLFQSGPPPPPPMPIPPIPPPAVVIEQAFQQQIQALQERLRQSEINLAAQHDSMQINKKTKVQENIRAARQARISAQANESNIDMNELDRTILAIVEACTKDNISSGRNCIFNYSQTPMQAETICLYLIDRLFAPEATSDTYLHLIYLINDVLHNCLRKGNDELRIQLSKIIVPSYCLAIDQSNDERKQKLVKLLDLWGKNKYFNDDIMEKLCDVQQAKRHYEDAIRIEYAPIIEAIGISFDENYAQLERQHAEFALHIQTQINQIQQQIVQFHQVQQQTPPPPPPHLLNNTFGPPLPPNMLTRMPPPSQSNNSIQQPPPLMSLNPFNENNRDNPSLRSSSNIYDNTPPALMSMPISHYDNNNQHDDYGNNNMNTHIEPPFDLNMVTDEIPYYDLPAGLMCLLVRDEDCDYNPIDPTKMYLPPSAPISERLLTAVENFYMLPTHETPRNAEGWERLGLFEYYKVKNIHKFSKERIINETIHQDNKDKRQRVNRSRSKSSSGSSSRSSSSSSSSSSSASSSSSSSSSASSSSKKNLNANQQKKRSRSRSGSPPYNKQYSSKNNPSTRSRSRSTSPPSFSTVYTPHSSSNEPSYHRSHHQHKLSDSNVGHKLLQKMGWQEGIGLGRREQGIVEPIAASTNVNNEGKMDQYKGIGHEDDPFEQFRKQKAKGYVTRLMAAQAETQSRRHEPGDDEVSSSSDRSEEKPKK